MMNIPVTIQLPILWEGTFEKTEWNSINFVVGANGTGKTLFAEKLKHSLKNASLKPRLLSAERLTGFEKQRYNYHSNSSLETGLNISEFDNIKKWGDDYGLSSSAFIILKERLDIRIKIEALLSDIFKKSIKLSEEGGFLKPKMQNINVEQHIP